MNPAAVLALADQAGVSFSISAAGKIKVKGGREQIARLDPLIKEYKDALLAHLKAAEQGTETSLGTVASPSNVSVAARCAEYIADENWCYRHTPDGYQWKMLPPGKHEWRRRNKCAACDWVEAGGAGLGH